MPINEKEIINKIRKGDLKIFEQLFRNFYPLLCKYAIHFVKDAALAEELVQELFYQLWKKRSQIQIHSSLKAYLYRATYHSCLQHMRRKNLDSKYEEYIKKQEFNAPSPIEALHEKEIFEITHHTLNTLPKRCSQIFKMNRFEGLKYQEIADKLSISIKTVEANMGKALKAFRHNLKDYVAIFLF